MSTLDGALGRPVRRAPLDAERVLELIVFGALPLVAVVVLAVRMFAAGDGALDFGHDYWVAASRLLNHGDPWAWSRAQLAGGAGFTCPAMAAIIFVPLALLPVGVADAVFTGACMVFALLTLRVLSVRDWRLYGLVLLWGPVVSAWQTANLTLLLGLGIALMWRYRDRPLIAGAIVALVISLKPFTWPLALWLLVTRRYRAACHLVWVGLALNLVAWLVVGPRRIFDYLRLSSYVTRTHFRTGYGIPALAVHLGLSPTARTVAELALALAVALVCVWEGRRGRDRPALTASIAIALLASPLLWSQYLALLIVPLALARPRLGWLWGIPFLLWACPANAVLWQELLLWAGAAVVLGICIRDADRPEHPIPRAPDGAPGLGVSA